MATTNDPSIPSAKEVALLHTNADTNGGPGSIHHTLGNDAGNSSPGNHIHDGGTSKLLLDGVILTGSKAANAALASVVAALVTLGATDNTT